MEDEAACPECEDKFSALGKHWRFSPEHRPEFTQYQKEVITGLLMGDGSINTTNKNPRLQCGMISPNYLEYIDDVFGCLGTGVSLKYTAEENAKRDRDSAFNLNAKEKNYSDMYRWQSRAHPDLQQWADWYSTGEKVWPKDIELTPIVLKHLYCGDGHWDNNGTKNRITISMANEINNTDKVDNMFQNVNLPAPSNYQINKQRQDGSDFCNALWTVNESKQLWEYMGKPLPDFEYKWPEQYR